MIDDVRVPTRLSADLADVTLYKTSVDGLAAGQEMEVTEGGSHTKVKVGNRQTTVPRHSEVNERTTEGRVT